jgi:hypothetical protein
MEKKVGDSQQIQVNKSESYRHFITLPHAVLKIQKQREPQHRLLDYQLKIGRMNFSVKKYIPTSHILI